MASVHRSAKTGRFVTGAAAARWPGKTTTERVGSGTSNSTHGAPLGVVRPVRHRGDRAA